MDRLKELKVLKAQRRYTGEPEKKWRGIGAPLLCLPFSLSFSSFSYLSSYRMGLTYEARRQAY